MLSVQKRSHAKVITRPKVTIHAKMKPVPKLLREKMRYLQK